MIDAALLRAIGSDETTNRADRPAPSDRRDACACALAGTLAGEALMDGERFGRLLRRLDRRQEPPEL